MRETERRDGGTEIKGKIQSRRKMLRARLRLRERVLSARSL